MRANTHSEPMSARVILLASLLFCLSPLAAQESRIESNIDTAGAALTEIDSLADACLQALESNSSPSSAAPTACAEFMAAIDGALVAGYIQQCRELNAWRDDYVERSIVTDSTGSDRGNDSTEILQRFIAIEFICAENSLVERTEFVATAFSRLNREATLAPADSSAASSRRRLERELNALDESERLRLLEAVRIQQNRNQRESERQFNQLDIELLRQQLPYPGQLSN